MLWSPDINMPPLKPDKDKNCGGSLVLNFRQWWRRVKTIYKIKEERDRPFLRSRMVCFTLQYLYDITQSEKIIWMLYMFEWHEQYLTSERTLHIIKRNLHWPKKTGKTMKYFAVHQFMWRLITTVISIHYTVACCPAHCNINSRPVYQDSRSWRNMSVLSELALYLLFICNGRNVFLLFILLSPRITDLPYREHFYHVAFLITQRFISQETMLMSLYR